MHGKVIGDSLHLCHFKSYMIQWGAFWWMTLLCWKRMWMYAKWLTTGLMIQKRKQVLWVWRIRVPHATWTLFCRPCTTLRTSARFSLSLSSFCSNFFLESMFLYVYFRCGGSSGKRKWGDGILWEQRDVICSKDNHILYSSTWCWISSLRS